MGTMRRFLLVTWCAALWSCGGDSAVVDAPDSGGVGDAQGAGDGGASGDSSADASVDALAVDASADASSNDASATDAPTIDGPTTFDPRSVSGLVVWLDANKGVTQTAASVSAWADQTSHGNDASQALSIRQPLFQASSINGRPALHFNRAHGGNKGDVLAIADAVSLQWGTGDFYVVVVARFDNAIATDGPGVLFDKSFGGTTNGQTVMLLGGIPAPLNGGVASDGLVFNTRVQAGDYITTTHAYNNGAPHAFAMQRVGVQLDLRVDATSITSGASSGVDVSNVGGGLGAGKVLIGSDYDAGSLRLNGDVAEVLAVKGALSATDRAALEGYLKAKYGL